MRAKESEAEINGINIFYREYGAGEPLLLIMGLSANADWWGESFIKRFAERYHVVAYDNRGAGRSGKPEGPYPIPLMASDAVGLMDHLGWDSAHVVGASMGGMIAQEIALEYPDRVRRLVLLCTTCGGSEQIHATKEVYELLYTPREGISAEDMARLSLPLLFPQRYIEENPQLMEEVLKNYLIAPIEPKCFVWQITGVSMWSCHSRLADLRHPTLIVAGSEDVLIPPENSRILAKAIPNSRLVEIEGAGHGFQAMYPDRLADEVLAFLQE
ncbi:MAG: alpha/beta fold hydrolase [Actinobacteria bacterium]|nr:alpha/beta fold hydrolase [Actinomycetota bacterium]